MSGRIHNTKLIRRFKENSDREPTDEEIKAFRYRYRNMTKYLKRSLNRGKITQEQYTDLKNRWESANVDNFRTISTCSKRIRK